MEIFHSSSENSKSPHPQSSDTAPVDPSEEDIKPLYLQSSDKTLVDPSEDDIKPLHLQSSAKALVDSLEEDKKPLCLQPGDKTLDDSSEEYSKRIFRFPALPSYTYSESSNSDTYEMPMPVVKKFVPSEAVLKALSELPHYTYSESGSDSPENVASSTQTKSKESSNSDTYEMPMPVVKKFLPSEAVLKALSELPHYTYSESGSDSPENVASSTQTKSKGKSAPISQKQKAPSKPGIKRKVLTKKKRPFQTIINSSEDEDFQQPPLKIKKGTVPPTTQREVTSSEEEDYVEALIKDEKASSDSSSNSPKM